MGVPKGEERKVHEAFQSNHGQKLPKSREENGHSGTSLKGCNSMNFISIPRYITSKLSKIKNKQRILKAVKETHHLQGNYMKTIIRFLSNNHSGQNGVV